MRRSSPPWPLSTGQKESGENGIMSKEKLGVNRFEKFRHGDWPAFQENYMKVGGQEVVTSGYGASKNVVSTCSGDGFSRMILN